MPDSRTGCTITVAPHQGIICADLRPALIRREVEFDRLIHDRIKVIVVHDPDGE
jgi:hypothetical protein